MATLKYWLWLTTRQGISNPATFRLLEHFGTPEAAFFADPQEYDLVEDLPANGKTSLLDKSTAGAERILEDCDRLGYRMMTVQDANYPERLKNIYDPPAVLYVRGRDIPFDEEIAVAVVGTRTPTAYGIHMAGKLGLELARSGAVLVSGIAHGLDTAALKGALNGGGQVVSVLAGGLDVVYPRENRFLYEDVASAGALLSEYPPGTENYPRNFPTRNRIISGLSLGVVAVEGTRHSGTLITAGKALEQNRDVFAVPGNADAPMSEGPNWLIGQGTAKLITCGWDVMEEYEFLYPQKIRKPERLGAQQEQKRVSTATKGVEPTRAAVAATEKEVDIPETRAYIDWKALKPELTDDQRDVLVALRDKVLLTDELIEVTQIPTRRILSALTMLQIRGYLEERPGKRFAATVFLK
ncbi:MAG: DNA-processing protein DprA [Oscillospiraceae bacterium]